MSNAAGQGASQALNEFGGAASREGTLEPSARQPAKTSSSKWRHLISFLRILFIFDILHFHFCHQCQSIFEYGL